MLSNPTTMPSRRDAVAPLGSGPMSPEATAATGAGEAQSLVIASPAPVLISEQQVRFATAAAGAAPHTDAIRHSWILVLWQRFSQRSSAEARPRRDHPYRRSSYIEHAAMAREMQRL
jgi:hypothetical protein